MKIKLKFILPNAKIAHQARNALLLAEVPADAIHFLASEKTNLGNLITASPFEGSNSIHEGEKGIFYGMGFGLLAGLYVLFFPKWVTVSPTWYSNAPWYVVLSITTAIGALFVAAGAAILGVQLFNTDLAQYQKRIAQGEILLLVTAPVYQAKKIRRILSTILNPGLA